MKTFVRLGVALAIAAAPTATPAADMARAELVNAAGAVIGTATFEQTPTGVLITVAAAGLAPGAHGIHLHDTGACAPDFTAAGSHINPDGASHGLRHPQGPDNGDLPNLFAAADGTARAQFFTARVSVAGGDMPALLDGDGSAVIVHEHPDDHMTQPIGGAGGRIACGIVRAM